MAQLNFEFNLIKFFLFQTIVLDTRLLKHTKSKGVVLQILFNITLEYLSLYDLCLCVMTLIIEIWLFGAVFLSAALWSLV